MMQWANLTAAVRANLARQKRLRHTTKQCYLIRELNLEPLEERRVLSTGALDLTFGDGGKVLTDIGPTAGTGDIATDVTVARQDDGKIIAVGQTSQALTGNDFAVVRYNKDGTIDTTFGENGTAVTDFGSTDDFACSVAVQPDGKIVVGGYSLQNGTGYDVALARYNIDGSLDATFGVEGRVVADFASHSDKVYSIAIDAAGRIVVAGCSYQEGSTGWDFALARFDTDGSLDATFSMNGLVTTDFGSSTEQASSIAIQSDGKIVAAGSSWQTGTEWDFALARYNENGSLDATFGIDGRMTTDVGSSESAFDVAIQPDGGIVVAGSVNYRTNWSSYTRFALARYTSDGKLDLSFDGDGTIIERSFVSFAPPGPHHDSARSVAIQSDGKIVAAGYACHSSRCDFAWARYNSDGSADSTFGLDFDQDGLPDGKVKTDFGSRYDYGIGLLIEGDKAIVAGYSLQGETSYDFAIARYTIGLNVGEISAPEYPIPVGVETIVGAAFTELDLTDTHTAVWNWGDGTTSDGTLTEPSGETPGLVSGSHVYSASGIYTVTVTVADDDAGESDSSVFEYVVAYDPDNGFVTGGGWMDSPSVYYYPFWPEGKVTFGFVAKYNDGDTVPTGQTHLQFKPRSKDPGDFRFSSTQYDWLVVSEDRAQFAGTGKIDNRGDGDYGFMITVIDGQVRDGEEDKLWIKIWDKATGLNFYDNHPRQVLVDDPVLAIRSGAIVVHDRGEKLQASNVMASENGATLTQSMLAPAIDEAISYWASAGIEADRLEKLRQIDVRVASLSGSSLGIASSSNLIWIDRDAAGHGWSASTMGSLPINGGGMDLFSVVTHEMGHKLGLDHDSPYGVMAAVLSPRVQRLLPNGVSPDTTIYGFAPSIMVTPAWDRTPEAEFFRPVDLDSRDRVYETLGDTQGLFEPAVQSASIALDKLLTRTHIAMDVRPDDADEEEVEWDDLEALLSTLAQEPCLYTGDD